MARLHRRLRVGGVPEVGREVLPAAVGEDADDDAAVAQLRAEPQCDVQTAPDETPAKIPSRSSSSRTLAAASAFETSSLRSSFETSRIGGT